MPNKILPFLAFALLLSATVSAQNKGGYSVSVFNQATSVPFTRLPLSPVHPGVELGKEFLGKTTPKFRLLPSFHLGYMYHQKLFHGIYAGTQLGYDRKLFKRLYLKTALGLGYLHTFYTRQEYQFVDGKYQSKTDAGNSRIMPSLSLGLGYQTGREDASPELFVYYRAWIEYPYSPGFIPLMSHANLGVGYRFFITSNK